MEKLFHHLVRAIIVSNDKVLVAQAVGHRNTFLPGGHVDLGESAREALVREIKEEMGLDSSVSKFLGLVEHKWEKQDTIHYEINQVFEVICAAIDSATNPTSKENHLNFFWRTKNQLQDLQPYPFRKLIAERLSGETNIWWESTLNQEIDASNKN